MALVLSSEDPFEQQRSYNHSRKDVLDSLRFFFGNPAHPEKLDLYSEQHALSFYLPDAYAGQSLQLRDTLNSLILNAPDNWATTAMLPFKEVQGALNVEWDSIHFDQRLMQRVPVSWRSGRCRRSPTPAHTRPHRTAQNRTHARTLRTSAPCCFCAVLCGSVRVHVSLVAPMRVRSTKGRRA